MTDGKRAADEDNLEVYWEWEEIKKLPKNPRLLEQARGRAVKVISALLPFLPGKHRYKILYMVRPIEEVVDSQWAMLARQGKVPRSEKRHLMETLEHHSRKIREALAKSPGVKLLEGGYPGLVADPAAGIALVAEFLGETFRPGPGVLACVRADPHRHKR